MLAMNQDTRGIAIAVTCAFIAGLFGLWNALLEMEVLDLVNSKLTPEKQYRLLWGNHRYFELRSEYKKLFPEWCLATEGGQNKADCNQHLPWRHFPSDSGKPAMAVNNYEQTDCLGLVRYSDFRGVSPDAQVSGFLTNRELTAIVL